MAAQQMMRSFLSPRRRGGDRDPAFFLITTPFSRCSGTGTFSDVLPPPLLLEEGKLACANNIRLLKI